MATTGDVLPVYFSQAPVLRVGQGAEFGGGGGGAPPRRRRFPASA